MADVAARWTRLTPPGEGGVATLRVWGGGAADCVTQMLARPPAGARGLSVGRVLWRGESLDVVLVEVDPGPPPALTLGTHGSEVVVGRVVGALEAAGARAATFGDYLADCGRSGDLDRTQREARAALPGAPTPLATEVALRQLDGRLGDALRELASAAEAQAQERLRALDGMARLGRALFGPPQRLWLAGPAGSGRSTLFNGLAGAPLALVGDRPGTTRDWLTTTIEIAGVPFELLDGPVDGSIPAPPAPGPIRRLQRVGTGLPLPERPLPAGSLLVWAGAPPTASERAQLAAACPGLVRVDIDDAALLSAAGRPGSAPLHRAGRQPPARRNARLARGGLSAARLAALAASDDAALLSAAGRPGSAPLHRAGRQPSARRNARLASLAAIDGEDGLGSLRQALIGDLADALASAGELPVPLAPAQWAVLEALRGGAERRVTIASYLAG